MNKKLLFVLIVLALLAGAFIFAPWLVWAERGLVYVIGHQGIGQAKLHIESLSREGVVIKDLQVEGDTPFELQSLVVKFFPLTVESASMDFQGGTISVQDVPIPTHGRAPIDLPLKVRHVSLDALLHALTGDKATATGRVSGMLPITLLPDNTVLVHKASLRAEAPGKIVMSPDSIPGDSQQVTLVRGVMSNLNYSLLSIDLDSDANRKLSATLHVEGSNPDMYDGRVVKLNVNLSGDVLELVQQSLTTLDPKKLLEKAHEK